jgi:hypothetical protein
VDGRDTATRSTPVGGKDDRPKEGSTDILT